MSINDTGVPNVYYHRIKVIDETKNSILLSNIARVSDINAIMELLQKIQPNEQK